jgi:putative CocE/NonD family hydrolase
MKFFKKVQQLNKLIINPTYGLLILMFITSCSTLFAKEKNDITFKIPASLAKAELKNINQVIALLDSPQFLSELETIAIQLPSEVIAAQAMFNKTALLSIRNEHQELLTLIAKHSNALNHLHYSLHSQTFLALETGQRSDSLLFKQTLEEDLTRIFREMSDEKLIQSSTALGWSVPRAVDYVFNIYKDVKDLDKLTTNQAINIIVNTQLYQVISKVIPISSKIIEYENNQRYQIVPETLITTAEGIELTATIVRKKGDKAKRPTAFQFTIYADEASHIKTAIHAAAHGYVGVVANSRGKRLSTNTIVPWEHEGKDATAVIDWITKQSWSDGRVAMYGGSYNGFTQWAAAKYMHPALKTIVPYAAASPITGLPIENNIVITPNYEWAFHVTNNKTIDNSVYADWQKTEQLKTDLFESGRSIKDMPKLDNQPNPWFQKWLEHPSYDKYYQDMLPYETDYANINIPVLSITGYFDGGQISAIDFLTQHYKYNKNANHSLLIGPYNHGTAQSVPRSHHSNYQLDDVALEKDTEEVVFQWFDHVLFNKQKPKLIQDRVNYQLMGSNTWQHRSSYKTMNQESITFYLTNQVNKKGWNILGSHQQKSLYSINQTVDMADRSTTNNAPVWTVIQDQLPESKGLIFATAPFEETVELAGAITGSFSIAVNKKDVDFGYNFYEMTDDGKVSHLNRYQSRASYANDMSERELLTPNKKVILPIVNARMTAKLIKKGSRLIMVLDVNKNADAQVNMGSGKAVNDETIADAGEKLELKWFNDSQINIPLKKWHSKTRQ